ncbi:expressed unknown protein [Seminavis robusta]|uniref:Uncharacterized protein n=1 Tax=Seminavis robusta TaxID=568900 RepID=A0A9N8DAJ8_9STRA|nr:expressed unknown protein [Seminavis robusta]|eukprot:Sro35_g022390.1 n/a (854) ;mRNA; f:86493-89143
MADPSSYNCFDASFSYSQYHSGNPQPLGPPPSSHNPQLPPPNNNPSDPSIIQKPRKAPKRRKRHPPPGPAGAWFQSNNNSNNNKTNKPHQAQTIEEEDDAAPLQHRPSNEEEEESSKSRAVAVATYPAWTAMQCDCQWMVPDVTTSMVMATRYHCQRPHMDSDYVLLPQILCDAALWKLPEGKKLIVLVQSVACHHDDIWTVELQDDTGASIRAWIAPGFAQSEKRHGADHLVVSAQQRYIRPGYVWCIQDASLMLQDGLLPGEEEHNNNNRMLLIRQEHVTKVWTPQCLRNTIDQDTYKAWIERRKARHGTHKLLALENRKLNEVPDNHNDLHNKNQYANNNNDSNNHHGMSQDDEMEELHDDEEDEEDDHFDRFYNGDHRYQRLADDDDEMGELGGPRITSLHPHSLSFRQPSRPFMLSQQQQQQPLKSTNTTYNEPQPSGPLPSNNSDKMLQDDDDPNAILWKSIMDGPTQSQSLQVSQRVENDLAVTSTMSTAATPATRQQSTQPLGGNLVTDPRNPQRQPNTSRKSKSNKNRSRRVTMSQPLVLQPSMSQDTREFNDASGKENNNAQEPLLQLAQPGLSQFAAFGVQPTPSQQHPAYHEKTWDDGSNAGSMASGQKCYGELSQFAATPVTANQSEDGLSQFAATNAPKTFRQPQQSGPSQVAADRNAPVSNKAGKKNPGTDLSQFTAKRASQSQASNTDQDVANECLSSQGGVLPQKRQKKKSKTSKKKSPRYYDKSPPKPSAAKLWTTTSVLQDATGLLDLSSSDEEGDKPQKQSSLGSQPSATTKPLPASCQLKAVANKAKPNNEMSRTELATGGGVGVGPGMGSSLFQELSKPGIDWIGLSDEED